jgi:superfamily II DNA or RNA helicase/diadenosine tetraphosphate (Ap4A) HIT family hydrolase/HKD family nuclease
MPRLPNGAYIQATSDRLALSWLRPGRTPWQPEDYSDGVREMTDTDVDRPPCPFCNPPRDKILFEDEVVIALWDGYPASPGHTLLVPRRHVASWFDAFSDEKNALIQSIDKAKLAIEKLYTPDAYNIGINAGRAAGQTIFHLHVHVIPRYSGDVGDPRGGVRHVIPAKGNYQLGIQDAVPAYESHPYPLLISGGEAGSFADHLKKHLATASAVDIAVAFTMKSGVDILREAMQEVISRGGRLRFLTGDYLDATDPIALLQLLDLQAGPGSIDRRVYQTRYKPPGNSGLPTTFHPKAYIFQHRDGSGTAFVGSSNISRAALQGGVEWNYRIIDSRDRRGFNEIRIAFERLFRDPATAELTNDWVDKYSRRRALPIQLKAEEHPTAPLPETVDVPLPHSIQQEALAALQRSRSVGASAGLVVLATGLGKTWLSAFDSCDFERVLFVAHREEILSQAMLTFRRIRPREYLGHYSGDEKHPDAKVIFASIQTLSRQSHLDRFPRDHFDYIVIDEFHHASAATYRRLLQHFSPRYLLGLTATPERSDGADLLELCGGNLVFRCDLAEGIRRGLLCPFDYFGVPDEVDYTNIPWRSRRFDEEQLTVAVATQSRAANALEQLERRGGRRTLAFCVSQRHADFMAAFFNSRGKRAVAVHSGPDSAPRTLSLERLQSGELDIVCAVDMFNEGVDLPDLDTVMMLRPTESKILWLQQFGRGLRKATAEKRLRVIDYIGNHRTFLLKPQTLFNLAAGDQNIQNLLESIQNRTAELPPGCSVTYDLAAIDILRGLLKLAPSPPEALRTYVQDFIELHGVRPTALEAYRDGYAPRSVRRQFESWLGFLDAMQFLSEPEARARTATSGFLDSLEVTPMAKSYKMVVLLAMLNDDKLPGSIGVDQLTAAVRLLWAHHPKILADFDGDFTTDASLRGHLEINPIRAWVDGAGTGGKSYFSYDGNVFASIVDVPAIDRTAFQELARELAEWRLAEYLDRPGSIIDGTFLIKVNQSNGNPILMPLNREANLGMPVGWTPFIASGQRFKGNFAKIALNVAKKEGSDRNELPSILRGWFGPDAGAPGTRHQVQLAKDENGWTLAPVGVGIVAPVLWKTYSREQIPGLFGLEFNTSVWQQGFVRRGDKTFLLVTLDKSAAAEHKYEDRFLSATDFQWQSQNQTSRDSKAGESIHDHKKLGIDVLLFVRPRSKTRNGKASPFVYCGPVNFVDWDGDKPITVTWRLYEEVPARLAAELRVPT